MSEQSKMTNEEAQKREDMLLDMYKINAYIPNDAQGNPLTPFGNFCAGYEAAIAYMQEVEASSTEKDKLVDKTDTGAATLRPIDIEKLSADINITTEKLKQFAEAYAAKVLEDKEREIAELKTTVRSDNSKVIAALNAHINDLREALEEISNWKFGWDGDCGVTAVAEQALTKTPAQSLQSVINETIERCAKLFEGEGNIAGNAIALAIRALKEGN